MGAGVIFQFEEQVIFLMGKTVVLAGFFVVFLCKPIG
jgi:hypothetical protein